MPSSVKRHSWHDVKNAHKLPFESSRTFINVPCHSRWTAMGTAMILHREYKVLLYTAFVRYRERAGAGLECKRAVKATNESPTGFREDTDRHDQGRRSYSNVWSPTCTGLPYSFQGPCITITGRKNHQGRCYQGPVVQYRKIVQQYDEYDHSIRACHITPCLTARTHPLPKQRGLRRAGRCCVRCCFEVPSAH